jgi:hypothetical protein
VTWCVELRLVAAGFVFWIARSPAGSGSVALSPTRVLIMVAARIPSARTHSTTSKVLVICWLSMLP